VDRLLASPAYGEKKWASIGIEISLVLRILMVFSMTATRANGLAETGVIHAFIENIAL